jgi:uncharacterized RDD family membrane protein YckC
MENNVYPEITKRVRAIFLDGFILIGLMTLSAIVFSVLDPVPNAIPMCLLLLFFLYDPILVSVFGGTIGHICNGMRVKDFNNQLKNLSFTKALWRFLVKSFWGWVTYIPALNGEHGRAIHDKFSGSIVIYAP